jgi:hypothetical protein
MTGNALLLYKVTCPPDFKEEEFETFVNDEVFPAIFQKASRIGEVTGLSLWRDGQTKHFLWAVEYSGLGEGAAAATKDALEKLEAKGIKVTSTLYGRAS